MVVQLEKKKVVDILKAISDIKRFEILQIVNCEETCICELMDKFNVTQPTLSHDMKILHELDLVNSRKDGKWNYYSLNKETLMEFYKSLGELLTENKHCDLGI